MSDSEKPSRGDFRTIDKGAGSPVPMRLRVKLLEEQLPRASLASLGKCSLVMKGRAKVKVVASMAILKALLDRVTFSDLWEDGGFLVGHAYADTEDGADAYVVSISAAPRARATTASLLALTYTGDSFTEVKRLLRDELPGQQLLGWYHTHLFAAAEEMGLSAQDVHLHFSTFRQPWQVAGLVNLPPQGRPTLRFYAVQDKSMALCPVYCCEADQA